jgi:hypothetical protein
MKLKAYLAFSCAAVFPSWWVSGFPHRDAHSQGMDLEAPSGRESRFFIPRLGLKTRINSLRHSPKNIHLSKGVIIAPAVIRGSKGF